MNKMETINIVRSMGEITRRERTGRRRDKTEYKTRTQSMIGKKKHKRQRSRKPGKGRDVAGREASSIK